MTKTTKTPAKPVMKEQVKQLAKDIDQLEKDAVKNEKAAYHLTKEIAKTGKGVEQLESSVKDEPKKLGAKAATKSEIIIGQAVRAATAKRLGNKPPPPKIEAKEIPKIVPHGGLTKEKATEVLSQIPDVTATATKPAEKPAMRTTSVTTAKLPAKPTGAMAKMDKIQSAIKQAVRAESHQQEVPEQPGLSESNVNVPKVAVSTHLDPAMVRKAATPTKKTSAAAPGKISFEEIQQNMLAQAPVAPPLFDISKYLKK